MAKSVVTASSHCLDTPSNKNPLRPLPPIPITCSFELVLSVRPPAGVPNRRAPYGQMPLKTDISGPPVRGPPRLRKPHNNIQNPSTRRESVSEIMILGDICESSFVMVISFLLGMYTMCSLTGPAGSGYIVR